MCVQLSAVPGPARIEKPEVLGVQLVGVSAYPLAVRWITLWLFGANYVGRLTTPILAGCRGCAAEPEAIEDG